MQGSHCPLIIPPHFTALTALTFYPYARSSTNFACMKGMWLIAFNVIPVWMGCMVA